MADTELITTGIHKLRSTSTDGKERLAQGSNWCKITVGLGFRSDFLNILCTQGKREVLPGSREPRHRGRSLHKYGSVTCCTLCIISVLCTQKNYSHHLNPPEILPIVNHLVQTQVSLVCAVFKGEVLSLGRDWWTLMTRRIRLPWCFDQHGSETVHNCIYQVVEVNHFRSHFTKSCFLGVFLFISMGLNLVSVH